MSQPNEFLRKYNVYDLFIYNHDNKFCRKFQQIRIGILIKSEHHIDKFFLESIL